jgi:hypothetical protein
MSATAVRPGEPIIRYAVRVAAGVECEMRWMDGAELQLHWTRKPDQPLRGQALRRFAAGRVEFLTRVAAATGVVITLVDPGADVPVVDFHPPAAGHA